MKEGLLDNIRSHGYWRVNIRPTVLLKDQRSLGSLEEASTRSAVSMRGWDFPHISRHNDDSGGYARHNEYVESWCDWNYHVEFWRMYRSMQFLAYRAIWEDRRPQDPQNPRPAGRLLSVQGAIWSVVEFLEFLHRLRGAGLYEDGAEIAIALRNSRGRKLWIHQFRRAPFSYDRSTEADEVAVSLILSAGELSQRPVEPAATLLLDLFDRFGWNPTREHIIRDVEAYYRGELD